MTRSRPAKSAASSCRAGAAVSPAAAACPHYVGLQLETHGLPEGKALFHETPDLLVGPQGLLELFRIYPNPFVLDEGHPFPGGNEPLRLFRRYFLIAEQEGGTEIEDGVHAHVGGPLFPDPDAEAGTGGLSLPPVGNAADDARVFIDGDLREECIGLPGRPDQRMEQLPRVDEGRDEGALLCPLVHRHQKIEEAPFIAGVFREGMLQGQMAGLLLPPAALGIGGEKGEGPRLAPVLHEMEENPARQMDLRAQGGDIGRHGPPVGLHLPGKGTPQPFPEATEEVRGQVFHAGGGGGLGCEGGQFFLGDLRRRPAPEIFQIGGEAEPFPEDGAERPPEGQRQGKGHGGVGEPEKQKPGQGVAATGAAACARNAYAGPRRGSDGGGGTTLSRPSGAGSSRAAGLVTPEDLLLNPGGCRADLHFRRQPFELEGAAGGEKGGKFLTRRPQVQRFSPRPSLTRHRRVLWASLNFWGFFVYNLDDLGGRKLK